MTLEITPGFAMTPDRLMRRYIGNDPFREGPEEAVVKGSRLHVWALVGYLKSNEFDIIETAKSYEIAPRFVRATATYYLLNQEAINRRLQENLL